VSPLASTSEMGGLGADAAEQGVDDLGGERVGVPVGCSVLTDLVDQGVVDAAAPDQVGVVAHDACLLGAAEQPVALGHMPAYTRSRSLPSMRALLIEKPQPILTRSTFAVA
jgi:hypothetical protein